MIYSKTSVSKVLLNEIIRCLLLYNMNHFQMIFCFRLLVYFWEGSCET